jgi:hypothetical protein
LSSNPFDARPRAEIAAAYARWLTMREEADEWSWEVVHDAVWWYAQPLDMLGLIIDIANRVAEDPAALNLLGAGPLEDLLGADAPTMAAAAEEARRNPAFRAALGGVYGVMYTQPGYEELRRAIDDASA